MRFPRSVLCIGLLAAAQATAAPASEGPAAMQAAWFAEDAELYNAIATTEVLAARAA